MLVPGHSGGGVNPALGQRERRRLASAFRPYAGEVDHVLVDTATGIGPEAMALVAASDLILLVLSAEPTAFMDAYQLVKLLAVEHDRTEISVVTNMVEDEPPGASCSAISTRWCAASCRRAFTISARFRATSICARPC
jgi:flagellar biosynthesis protein FlhG